MTSPSEIDARKADSDDSGSARDWRILLLWTGIVASTVIAFRAIVVAPFGLIEPSEFEYWFFIPARDSGALSVLVASWLLWNRRTQLVRATGAGVGWIHWILALVILVGFTWSLWSGAPMLLIPILAAHLFVLAIAWGGTAGFRVVSMPCIALLLAFSPPSPLEAEIIWSLQQWTAVGANGVLSIMGLPVQLEGTEILMGDNAFAIIEACSGWRGIQVLSVVALVASELRGLRLSRALWVVAAAVPLGLLLNMARVCLVVLTQDNLEAEFFENHTPQGIAVLLIGSVLLYVIALRIQRYRPSRNSASAPDSPSAANSPARPLRSFAVFALALCVVLGSISLVLPAFHEPRVRPDPGKIVFPEERPPWIGTKLPPDYFFPYSTVAPAQFHFEYRNPDAPGGGELVDLYIAREFPDSRGLDRLPETKLLLPANDWNIDSHEPKRIWTLGIEGERAILSREGGSRFTYVEAWRLGDEGLLRESLKSMLGLNACNPSDPDCFRTVLRIAVPILHDDDRGREHAMKTAENFVRDFKDAFEALETD